MTLDNNAITAAVSGNTATFEFRAGFKDSEKTDSSPHGQVVCIDDGFECSLRMRSTSVAAYLEKGPNSRRIQGTPEINGHDGTYQLDVTDDDSATDSYAICLSNGYSVSGKLKGGHIEIRERHSYGKNEKDNEDKDEDH